MTVSTCIAMASAAGSSIDFGQCGGSRPGADALSLFLSERRNYRANLAGPGDTAQAVVRAEA